jgi:fructose-1,6-bisphosphatase/inositol monophosphatase family enzyme/transcriptional regulator with XRE-family HTH domain
MKRRLQPELGENLAALMKTAALSDATVARRAALSERHVVRLRKGENEPNDETLRRLCQALGLLNSARLHPELGGFLQTRFKSSSIDGVRLGDLVGLACQAAAAASFPVLAHYSGLAVAQRLSGNANASTTLDVQATSALLRTLLPTLADFTAPAPALRFCVYGEELDTASAAVTAAVDSALAGLPGRQLLSRNAHDFSRRMGDGSVGILFDALDGTANAVHGLAFFASAIAMLEQGCPTVGAVFDPVRQEMFYGTSPLGAAEGECRLWHLGHAGPTRLVEPDTSAAGFPIIATHLSRQDADTRDRVGAFVGKLPARYTVSAYNSGQLTLAFVAAGRVAAYVNPSTSIWDCCAGEVLIRSSGRAIISTFDGSPIDYLSGETRTSLVAAATPEIHEELLHALESSYREPTKGA